eukprot:4027866-Pyramimonas_sp.AAC.2
MPQDFEAALLTLVTSGKTRHLEPATTSQLDVRVDFELALADLDYDLDFDPTHIGPLQVRESPARAALRTDGPVRPYRHPPVLRHPLGRHSRRMQPSFRESQQSNKIRFTGINWKIASTYEPKIMLTNSPARISSAILGC